MTATAKLERKIEHLENFQEIVRKFVVRLGDPSEFEFRNEVIDLGSVKGKCTCDQPIRYMFLIWGPNGRVAPVGCECIKHFQAYNETLFGKLEHAREGLMEALAREKRESDEAQRQDKVAEILPCYELARRKFLAVCKMHKDNIGYMLPRAMWLLQSDLMKKVQEYKTTNGYINFYKTTIVKIETVLGKYERGELR
jgi:hypothetical protein